VKTHCRYTGIKGFVGLYDDALRFRDMITPKAEERVRILAFWEKHGDTPTKEAFKVSRASLFRWQKILHEGSGKIDALVHKSTAPKNKRKRIIPDAMKNLIIEERSHENVGKEKLAVLLKEDEVAVYSPSTVGRILGDLKQRGALPNPVKLTLNGKTGNLMERKPRKRKKKLRSMGHTGGLVKADTVVRFTNGVKRYILTAIDLESEFAFAYGYASHASIHATDFMRTFKEVEPISLTHVQTDNGSEFQDHFETYCEESGIIQFHAYPRTPKMQSEIERFKSHSFGSLDRKKSLSTWPTIFLHSIVRSWTSYCGTTHEDHTGRLALFHRYDIFVTS